MSFWTDSKVADNFTPEDKFFFLYLLTNPLTNTCGCYEISIRQMTIDTGYSKETVEKLLLRLQNVHKVISYSKENKEVLLVNWRKYNWTVSEKLRISILNSIKPIKTKAFKDYLLRCYENLDYEETFDTLSIGYDEPIDTVSEEDNTPIETVFSLGMDSLGMDSLGIVSKDKKVKEVKHEYGEYKHVKLTDSQYDKLVKDYGEDAVKAGIKNVDEYCQEYGKAYKDYNLTLRRWGIKSEKIDVPQQIDSKQVKRELQ